LANFIQSQLELEAQGHPFNQTEQLALTLYSQQSPLLVGVLEKATSPPMVAVQKTVEPVVEQLVHLTELVVPEQQPRVMTVDKFLPQADTKLVEVEVELVLSAQREHLQVHLVLEETVGLE
jgi:hypothetical protein